MAEMLPDVAEEFAHLRDVSDACAHLETAYEALHKAEWLLEDEDVDGKRLRRLVTDALLARQQAMKVWKARSDELAAKVNGICK